jgi:hypothetical protein
VSKEQKEECSGVGVGGMEKKMVSFLSFCRLHLARWLATPAKLFVNAFGPFYGVISNHVSTKHHATLYGVGVRMVW